MVEEWSAYLLKTTLRYFGVLKDIGHIYAIVLVKFLAGKCRLRISSLSRINVAVSMN